MEIIQKIKKNLTLKEMFILLEKNNELLLAHDLEAYARWLATTLKNQKQLHFKVNRKENHILVTRL
jgi:tRNA G46 methylase TrmB